MAVTRLKRKDRKNKARANNRIERIKHLLIKPVVKHVDLDELRAKYGSGSSAASSTDQDAKSSREEGKAKRESAPKKAVKEDPSGLDEAIVAEHNDQQNRSTDEVENVEPEMTSAGSEDKE